MANLINHVVMPFGLRICYWADDYIPAPPFCLSSKLSDQENKIICDFEEMKCFERSEEIKAESKRFDLALQGGGETQDEDLINFEFSSRFIDAKKAVALYFAGPKKLYFVGFAKREKEVGFNNIQTNGGPPPKTIINRSDFLTR